MYDKRSSYAEVYINYDVKWGVALKPDHRKMLFLILAFGFIFRIALIPWGNPFFMSDFWDLHPDEPKITTIIKDFPETMIKPNVEAYVGGKFYIWPKGMSNVGGIIWKITTGTVSGFNKLGLAYTIARIMSVFGSLLGIFFAYKLGALLFNQRVGIYAAAILNFPSYYLMNAGFATPDALSAAIFTIGVWYSCFVYKYKDLRLRSAIIAGIILGFGVSIKYTTLVLIVVYPLVLIFITRRIKFNLLLTYLVCALFSFIIIDPQIVFRTDLLFSSIEHLSRVHSSLSNWSNSYNIIKGLGWAIFLPSLIGVFIAIKKKKSFYLIIVLLPVLAYLIKTAPSFTPRYAISVAPVMAVFAGYCYVFLFDYFKIDINRKKIIILFVSFFYLMNIAYIYKRYEGDSRYRLMSWIDKNLGQSTRVTIANMNGLNRWFYPRNLYKKFKLVKSERSPEILFFDQYSMASLIKRLNGQDAQNSNNVLDVVYLRGREYSLLKTIEPANIEIESLGPTFFIYKLSGRH